jgi:hypothetical protein
LSFAIKIRK